MVVQVGQAVGKAVEAVKVAVGAGEGVQRRDEAREREPTNE